MRWPRIFRIFVFITAVCVAVLFFFPLSFGTFQATHGPTTEFRSLRATVAIVLSIAGAVHAVTATLSHPAFSSLPRIAPPQDQAESSLDPRSSVILRC
jgi:hypothetical protein